MTPSEADALAPEYAGTFDSPFGHHVLETLPGMVEQGWSDDEVMDRLGGWTRTVRVYDAWQPLDKAPMTTKTPTLREMNAARELLGVLRRRYGSRAATPSHSGPERIVTRDRVLEVQAELRAAGRHSGADSIARALRVSEKTVRRRLKGD